MLAPVFQKKHCGVLILQKALKFNALQQYKIFVVHNHVVISRI